jgi:hypothetical protein
MAQSTAVKDLLSQKFSVSFYQSTKFLSFHNYGVIMEDQQPLPSGPPLGQVITDIFASPSDIFQKLKNSAPSPMLWVLPLIAMLFIVTFTVFMLFTNEPLKAEMKEIQSKTDRKSVV